MFDSAARLRSLLMRDLPVIGALYLYGCTTPDLVIESPKNNTVVSPAVAVRISWNAGAQLQGPLNVTIDGNPVNPPLTIGYALVIDAATGTVNLAKGSHTMTASGTFYDKTKNTTSTSTATASFQVDDAKFTMAIDPTSVALNPGGGGTVTVTLTRATGFTDPVALTTSTLPTGVTVTPTDPGAGNSGSLAFAAAQTAPGTPAMGVMVTGTSSGGSAFMQTQTLQISVVPTWTDIYNKYFTGASTLESAGHCGKCHAAAHGGFTAGGTTDKSLFYTGLVNAGLVNGVSSSIGNPASSPLIWVNPSGNMPADNLVANAAAGADIQAWVAAGAPNN